MPVYNEEEYIGECIQSILKQNYPKENYEIIIVNDGSTDNTKQVIKKYPVKLVDLKKNQGRLIARQIGAKSAKYENLLFIDSRCIAYPNILRRLSRLKENAVIGNALMNKKKTDLDHFFYLIRKKYYGSYFNTNFKPFYINKKNFDRIPKGTGVFFCKRDLFFRIQPKVRKKNISDDITLFSNIINYGIKILKHPKILIQYRERNNLNESLIHIYNRGKKFSDFYLREGGTYYNNFLYFNILLAIYIIFSIIYWPIFIIGLFIMTIFYFLVPLNFVIEKGDYPIMIKYQGPIALSFFAGIISVKRVIYVSLLLISFLLGTLLIIIF